MIQITRSEADMLREELPSVSIKRTVHKYYVEEQPIVLRLLGKVPPDKRSVKKG